MCAVDLEAPRLRLAPNQASLRVLEKLGMRRERRSTVQGLDTVFFSLRREDWVGGV